MGRMEVGEDNVLHPLYAALLLGSPLETRETAIWRMCTQKDALLEKTPFILQRGIFSLPHGG